MVLIWSSTLALCQPSGDKDGKPQWYVHVHQTDNNRVLSGSRLFELYNPSWPRQALVRLLWTTLLVPWRSRLELSIALTVATKGSLLLNHAIGTGCSTSWRSSFLCHCDEAFRYAAHYHGISEWGVTEFINHGEYA